MSREPSKLDVAQGLSLDVGSDHRRQNRNARAESGHPPFAT